MTESYPVTVDAAWTANIRIHDLETGGVVTVNMDGDIRQLIKHLPEICNAAAGELMQGDHPHDK
jgi:hypothetical protein